MHLAQSRDELARVQAREGCTPVELLTRTEILRRAPSVVLAHAIYVPTRDFARPDGSRHTLVFCPSSQLQFGFPADVAAWNAHQLAWVVATDCASSNDSMNLQKELRWCHGAAAAGLTGSPGYAAFLRDGDVASADALWRTRGERVAQDAPFMRSEALLARVWQAPGALHPGFRAGVIAEGALANLIVWDTDHPAFWPAHDLPRALALSDTTQAIHTLLVCGQPIGRVGGLAEGVLASSAYREARREANERLARLLAA
jgi:5-methylthioadenosine/S-adenosylhomocysteine deaminase